MLKKKEEQVENQDEIGMSLNSEESKEVEDLLNKQKEKEVLKKLDLCLEFLIFLVVEVKQLKN